MSTCKRGHDSGRYKNGACIECVRIRNNVVGAKWRANPDNAARKRRVAKVRYDRIKRDPEFLAKSRANSRKRLGIPSPNTPEPSTCEICALPQTGRCLSLAADHDHETKEHRGWLCTRCNRGIGLFRDNPATLRRAAAYLERA